MYTSPDLVFSLIDEDDEVYRSATLKLWFGELRVSIERLVDPDDHDAYFDGYPNFTNDEHTQLFPDGASMKRFVGVVLNLLMNSSFAIYVGGERMDDDEALDRIGDHVGLLNSNFTLTGPGREPIIDADVARAWATYPA